MMNDDQASLFMLSILVTLVIAPAAITVWLLSRALRRSRALNGENPQRGFELVVGRRAGSRKGGDTGSGVVRPVPTDPTPTKRIEPRPPAR